MENGDNGFPVKSISQIYNDDRTAKVLNNSVFIKTPEQNQFLIGTLRRHNVHNVLDVACGTGPDSIQLVEAGFKVVSTDFSDKMLKYALEERWDRRREPNFDQWVIKEADWMTLDEDLAAVDGIPEGGFDAVICMGSSIAHVPEPNCDQTNTRRALKYIRSFVKPGGLLMVDHRNFDYIVATKTLPESINYPWLDQLTVDSSCKVLYNDDGRPKLVISSYDVDVKKLDPEQKKLLRLKSADKDFHVDLTLFPHSLADFMSMLNDTVGPGAKHEGFGNFQPIGQVESPAYYQHVITMPV